MRKSVLALLALVLAAIPGVCALAEGAEIAVTPVPAMTEEWEYGEATDPIVPAMAAPQEAEIPAEAAVAIDQTAVPQKGPAATRVMTQLLGAPQSGAAVLMTYYPGVRVQVVRQADAEYVQVNVGNRPGTLTGYMRASDLSFTELGVRSVQGVLVTWDYWQNELAQQPHIYSYMDELSQDLGLMGNYSVLGVSEDGWLHVTEGERDPNGATGFVYRGEDTSSMSMRIAPYVRTLPAEGEMSIEEAIEFAKETMLSDNAGDYRGDPVSREYLDRSRAVVEVLAYPDEPLMYSVTFWYDLSIESTSDEFYAGIAFQVEGTEVISTTYGVG